MQLVFMKAECVHMKGKGKGSWLKLLGGPLRKRLEHHEKRNLCTWRGICAHDGEKSRFLTKIDGGSPKKKAGKSPKINCFYEGEYVDMKAKSKGFWLKLMGGLLRTRLENHERSNLCLWKEYLHMAGKSEDFWLKLIGGPLRKRLEHQRKKLVFMKGNMWTWRRKVRVSD